MSTVQPFMRSGEWVSTKSQNFFIIHLHLGIKIHLHLVYYTFESLNKKCFAHHEPLKKWNILKFNADVFEYKYILFVQSNIYEHENISIDKNMLKHCSNK